MALCLPPGTLIPSCWGGNWAHPPLPPTEFISGFILVRHICKHTVGAQGGACAAPQVCWPCRAEAQRQTGCDPLQIGPSSPAMCFWCFFILYPLK